MKQYSLTMPKTVYSGCGALEKIKEITEGRYKKAAVFTDKGIRDSGILEVPLRLLKSGGLEVTVIDELAAEPDYMQAQSAVDRFRRTGADLIVAVGGGSVMDIAKLASVAATDEYGVKELLERPLLGRKKIPTVMIPTTAGTGSEATANSIVAEPEKKIKTGIVNPEMISDYVILDGSMTKNLPKRIAAATGIDALCHAIECYTSNKANPFSNLFAMEALKLIFGNIEAACLDPAADESRNNMLLAAFYGGAAISSSGTTAVHALSYPLGGRYHIPHGVANAMLLVPVMRFNEDNCLKELAEVYDAVCGENKENLTAEMKSDRIINRMDEIIGRLEIPRSLSAYDIGSENMEEMITAGLEVRRLLDNNKKMITREDAGKIYMEIM